jgi:hypothetical protein
VGRGEGVGPPTSGASGVEAAQSSGATAPTRRHTHRHGQSKRTATPISRTCTDTDTKQAHSDTHLAHTHTRAHDARRNHRPGHVPWGRLPTRSGGWGPAAGCPRWPRCRRCRCRRRSCRHPPCFPRHRDRTWAGTQGAHLQGKCPPGVPPTLTPPPPSQTPGLPTPTRIQGHKHAERTSRLQRGRGPWRQVQLPRRPRPCRPGRP